MIPATFGKSYLRQELFTTSGHIKRKEADMKPYQPYFYSHTF